jgi:hypothetical protein
MNHYDIKERQEHNIEKYKKIFCDMNPHKARDAKLKALRYKNENGLNPTQENYYKKKKG